MTDCCVSSIGGCWTEYNGTLSAHIPVLFPCRVIIQLETAILLLHSILHFILIIFPLTYSSLSSSFQQTLSIVRPVSGVTSPNFWNSTQYFQWKSVFWLSQYITKPLFRSSSVSIIFVLGVYIDKTVMDYQVSWMPWIGILPNTEYSATLSAEASNIRRKMCAF